MKYGTAISAYYVKKLNDHLYMTEGQVVGEVQDKYIFCINKKKLHVNKWQVMDKSNYDREHNQKI